VFIIVGGASAPPGGVVGDMAGAAAPALPFEPLAAGGDAPMLATPGVFDADIPGGMSGSPFASEAHAASATHRIGHDVESNRLRMDTTLPRSAGGATALAGLVRFSTLRVLPPNRGSES
jgi:hypothetical protein